MRGKCSQREEFKDFRVQMFTVVQLGEIRVENLL